MSVVAAGRQTGLAAVEPEDADPVTLGDRRDEPVLGGRRIVVNGSHRSPTLPAVVRPGEPHVVGVRVVARFRGPVSDHPSASVRGHRREVRPVGEKVAARGDRDRVGPPSVHEAGKAERVLSVLRLHALARRLEPGEQHVFRVERKVGGSSTPAWPAGPGVRPERAGFRASRSTTEGGRFDRPSPRDSRGGH
jgi:hypothetical protein